MHAVFASRQVNARNAAIAYARSAAEAIHLTESQRLQAELHRLYQQAVLNNTLACIQPPTMDSFIQSMQKQTIIHQVAHQNGANQVPADKAIPGPPAPRS